MHLLRTWLRASEARVGSFLRPHHEVLGLLAGLLFGAAVGDLLRPPLWNAGILLAVVLAAAGRYEKARAVGLAALGLVLATLFLSVHIPPTEVDAEIMARFDGDLADAPSNERVGLYVQMLIGIELLVGVALGLVDAALDLHRNRAEHLHRWESERDPS